MSKPYYETEEYSEAENELDTYDDPVKLVMEYRISEKQKDSQITELQKELKSQPTEIVEKIKGQLLSICQIRQYHRSDEMIMNFQAFNNVLDTILKEYGE